MACTARGLPMNAVAIREASTSDTAELLPLIEAYWRHEAIAGYEGARLRRQLEEFLSTPAYGRGWLAMRTGVAVGYLLCTLAYSFEHGGLMAEVDEFFVGAPYRRQGIGQALLARARSSLAALGCVCLQMQVADGNAQARDFYTRQGFEEKSGYRLWLSPLHSSPPH
jgi:ribosomal protein S18 acetylase RimI-like enzyme